jgi:hypothetical protein
VNPSLGASFKNILFLTTPKSAGDPRRCGGFDHLREEEQKSSCWIFFIERFNGERRESRQRYT